jgi:AraC-like DNA-binding protein
MASHVITYLLLVSCCLLVLRSFKKATASQYVQVLFFLWWVIYTSLHLTTGRYYLASTVTGGAFLFLLVPLSYAYRRKPKPLSHARTVILKFISNCSNYMQRRIGFSRAVIEPGAKLSHSVFLSRDRMSQIEERVRDHFQERRPYLQRSYSLKMLADDTHISVHQLSAFINQYYKINFNDFVNEYRVITCIEKLLDMEWKQKKLEAIAEESGFNNRNTFTVAFRKVAGLNPSQFLKDIKLGKHQSPDTHRFLATLKKFPQMEGTRKESSALLQQNP